MITLSAAIGRYPQTAALLDGVVRDGEVALDCTPFPVISRAFAPMVREGRFDVSEMAIATWLQAWAHGKPLVLLPRVLAARMQEGSLFCRTDSPIRGPGDLLGKRVGVRAYSQTTGLWLRGILQDAHGVAPESVRWITFEDAHVAECRDPDFATRAPAGSDMVQMLKEGALDAIISGNDAPSGDWLRPVFPDPAAASAEFLRRHGFTPINHLLVMRAEHAHHAAAVLRLMDAAGAAPSSGRVVMMPAIAFAAYHAVRQGLILRAPTPQEIWAGLPPDIT
ncbi:ABC transporter substrate-binding protein [Sediminicoccus sp. KRV36]|uniref:ABC transporter substrate-binding protein n=1 Tax=Sediminicoccus sp. KRV36 TaxID=3133721 RepID=UPI00200C3005|nr:ABC transporter substrate-binding protein [Sediminicoccus rosea]UPY34915.1 ABC transporter substrate-binding protein [Sediminicoccus rosea]